MHSFYKHTCAPLFCPGILSSYVHNNWFTSGKQAKKSAHRKTIDYNATVLKTLQVASTTISLTIIYIAMSVSMGGLTQLFYSIFNNKLYFLSRSLTIRDRFLFLLQNTKSFEILCSHSQLTPHRVCNVLPLCTINAFCDLTIAQF